MKTHSKKFSEKFIEGLLLISGTVTSLTVLLIVVFLFNEGLGIFKEEPLEEGFSLVVNAENPVNELAAEEVKDLYDQKYNNWLQLRGINDSIHGFRLSEISEYYSEEQLGKNFEFLPQRLNELVSSKRGIIAYVPNKYLPSDFKGKKIHMAKITPGSFFKGDQWFPTAQPAAMLGVLPLILGTFLVSFGAILIALPLGLATSIYMAEIASPKIRGILKPVIELLAGIPSVVFGFFGLVIVVPLIQKLFNLPVGETALAGSIILGIMALPTIITISEDALRNTPRAMKEASLALGASQWQTIFRVVIPYSISGISAAAILGIGRAIGETMAVLMVTGNAAVIPHSFLAPVRTIPATIAAELGEAPQGGIHYKALFALGCILFLITMIINLSVEFTANKRKGKKH